MLPAPCVAHLRGVVLAWCVAWCRPHAVCCGVSLQSVAALCVALCELPGVVILVWCCGVSLWGVVGLCIALCELPGVVVLARCCGVLLHRALCCVSHWVWSSLCGVAGYHCGVLLRRASHCMSCRVCHPRAVLRYVIVGCCPCMVRHAVCCCGVLSSCSVLRGVILTWCVEVCNRVLLRGVVAPWVTLCELTGVVVLAWCCGESLRGVVLTRYVIVSCAVLCKLPGVSSLRSVVWCHPRAVCCMVSLPHALHHLSSSCCLLCRLSLCCVLSLHHGLHRVSCCVSHAV